MDLSKGAQGRREGQTRQLSGCPDDHDYHDKNGNDAGCQGDNLCLCFVLFCFFVWPSFFNFLMCLPYGLWTRLGLGLGLDLLLSDDGFCETSEFK